MIPNFFMGLVDSWLQGVASILPTVSFNDTSSNTHDQGAWIHGVMNVIGTFADWGVPVGTMVQILQIMLTMEIAYGTVLLAVFIYNRLTALLP